MNKFILFSSFLLTTSCLFNVSSANAIKLIESENDILEVSRSPFLQNEAKKKSEKFGLSHLPSIRSGHHYHTSPRRLYYMLGDGDCFFRAIRTTREKSVEKWLNHSDDPEVRKIAAGEILAMFIADGQTIDEQDGLPEAMKAKPQYITLKNAWNEIIDAQKTEERSPHFRYDSDAYQDILIRKDELKNRIRTEYCEAEETYRDYVNLVLSDSKKYIMFSQDYQFGVDQETFFCDALADIEGATFRVWMHNRTSNLLQIGHERLHGDLEWEVQHDGINHFNRVVRDHYEGDKAQAEQDEKEYLAILEAYFLSTLESKINDDFQSLKLERFKALSNNDSVSQEQKDKYKAKAESQKEKVKEKSHKISRRDQAAYYQAQVTAFSNHLKMLFAEINKKFETVTEDERTRAHEQAALPGEDAFTAPLERIQKIDAQVAAHTLKLPHLRAEYDAYLKKHARAETLLNSLNITPTEVEIADALLHTSLYYGNLAEVALTISEDQGESQEVRVEARKRYENHIARKKLFGETFDAVQQNMSADIEFKVKANKQKADNRLKENLAKNIRLGNDSFTDNFNRAQTIVQAWSLRQRENNEKYFNPHYLSANPFLGSHIPDIDEAYPGDISNDEWKTLTEQLQRHVLYLLLPEDKRAYLTEADLELPSILEYGEDLENLNEFVGIHLRGETILFPSEEIIGQRTEEGLPRSLLADTYVYMAALHDKLSTAFFDNTMFDQKMLARKRIKRIIDTFTVRAQENGDNAAEASKQGHIKSALLLHENSERCLDGIISDLDAIEGQLFTGSNSDSIESVISATLSQYIYDFYQRYNQLVDPESDEFEDIEWRTNVSQFIKQRLFFSLPNTGSPRTAFVFLPGGIRNEAEGILSVENLMGTFLDGRRVTYNGRQIDVPAFNGRKMVDLVEAAYENGFQAIKTGPALSQDQVEEFIARDPYMQSLYEAYQDAFLEGDFGETEFFKSVEKDIPGIGIRHDIRFKRELFEYILEKLGYIIDPQDIWGQRSQEFKAQQPKEVPAVFQPLPSAPEPEAPAQPVIDQPAPPQPGDAPAQPVVDQPVVQIEPVAAPTVTSPEGPVSRLIVAVKKRQTKSKRTRVSLRKSSLSRKRIKSRRLTVRKSRVSRKRITSPRKRRAGVRSTRAKRRIR
ncbi:MAG: hypothetical protein BGO67_08195 [Alphaproteobacteria bacterium 41-28]|nr:MAG: hypothetical protein BGO67_08195 [Alphaproteobacteria bacterium 41-28]